MRSKRHSHEFAKILQSALNKAQNESQLTVKDLIKDLTHQLRLFIKK